MDSVASTSQAPAPQDATKAKAPRPKRTYRACQPCRSRKLKCDLGDPDNPSEPPCRRCRRESRECVFVVRKNAKTYSPAPLESPLPLTTVPPQRPRTRKPAHSVLSAEGGEEEERPPARIAGHPYVRVTTSPTADSALTATGRPLPTRAEYDAAQPSPPVAPPEAAGYYFHPPPKQSSASTSQNSLPQRPPSPTIGYDPSDPRIHPHPASLPSAGHLPHRARRASDHPMPLHASRGNGDRSIGASSDEEDEDDVDPDASRHGHPHEPSDANVLLSSTLHNPSDALRLLATASSLRSTGDDAGLGPGADGSAGEVAWEGAARWEGSKAKGKEKEVAVANGPAGASDAVLEAGWERWVPVQEGMVSIAEAEVLLSFFETEMSPLYPLLSPLTFSLAHLPHLTSTESLLLAAMITISARYSSLPSAPRARAIHKAVADYIRDELIGLLDGSGALRHISSVEALLLLTEWPPVTDGRKGKRNTGNGWGKNRERLRTESHDGNGEDAEDEEAEELLATSTQYDGMSWSFIGCAVRLAQELGIHNLYFSGADKKREGPVSWQEERCLRTWIYCYNADRHVSVRLGRNAVIQAYMSSSWWEQVTSRASGNVRKEGHSEVWAERSLPQGLIAALLGTIQERLYPNKEITRSMLRTGHWESFIRSLDHELQMMLLKSKTMLQQRSVEATLLDIEFSYVKLYGFAIALRALQERLRRAVKANDLWFVSPSLLNLQEGQWVLDALAAAQSILTQTVEFLAPKGYLRLAPSRIYQRILFAATFLFKALAVGVVEHGQSKVLGLLDQAITALHDSAVDRQHIARGFAALLRRLQAQCKPTLLSGTGVRPAPAAANGSVHPEHPAASTTSQPSPRPQQPPLPAQQPSQPHPPDPLFTPASTGSFPSATTQTPRTHYLPPLASELPDAAATPVPRANVSLPPPGPFAAEPASEMAAGFKLGNLAFEFPELTFEWDPSAQSLAAGHEQDLLFQSLWGGGAAARGGQHGDLGGMNPALNLFGTLVGDEFGLDY
ncbi:hypothetical protein JCM1841_004532 [Sporobolomyces salmonicolor]